MAADRVLIRSFRPADLPALVAFWNAEFAAQPAEFRNARPITEAGYRQRVLDCPAFDAAGLLLGWRQDAAGGAETLVGLAHAFKPAPRAGAYARWEPLHQLALLYVRPDAREQGLGSRLLQAAESRLYYCPVHVGEEALPCYGTLEALRPPFFGTSERMGVSARNRTLIDFLGKRGYRTLDPGHVTMLLDLHAHPPVVPAQPELGPRGLRLVAFNQSEPFAGREPPDRPYYLPLGANGGAPYAGLALVDAKNLLLGHISWYPLRPTRAALTNFRLADALRGQGLGRFLLATALHAMATAPAPWGGFGEVELYTHLLHNARAVALYEARGFVVDEYWVSLVKT